MKRFYQGLISIFIIQFLSLSVWAADVTLQWNSVESAAGYKVYYGSSSGDYQTPSDVGNKTSHTMTLNPGTYYFAVTAYNSYGESAFSDEVSSDVPQPDVNPPTSVSLGADVESPQYEGTTVTFTAQAQGGTGPYEYQFWSNHANETQTMVQDYSTQGTFTWTVSNEIIEIGVFARTVGSNAAYEVSTTMPFSTDMDPPSDLSVASDLPGVQPEGTPMVFSAQAQGGSGDYEFQFWLSKGKKKWELAQDYSAEETFNWTAQRGYRQLGVVVRNAGSGQAYQKRKVLKLKILNNNQYNYNKIRSVNNRSDSLQLSPNLPAPQTEGTQVVFSAQADGGSGNYEYQFWVKSKSGWALEQDFSADSNFVCTLPDKCKAIGVVARDVGSDELYQQKAMIRYKALRN